MPNPIPTENELLIKIETDWDRLAQSAIDHPDYSDGYAFPMQASEDSATDQAIWSVFNALVPLLKRDIREFAYDYGTELPKTWLKGELARAAAEAFVLAVLA